MSSAIGLSLFCTISAAPSTVCTASVAASSALSPCFIPASIRLSININTYAGPLPLIPVTASSFSSGRLITVPRQLKSMVINCVSSVFLLKSDISTPIAPLPMEQGRLGIQRATLIRPTPKAFLM